jgi:magnesium-transporting ATPase (P-type)
MMMNGAFMPNQKKSTDQKGANAARDAAMEEAVVVLEKLRTSPAGLSEAEAAARLAEHGPNEVAQEKKHDWLWRLWLAVRNPLVILLTVLAIVTFATAQGASDGGIGRLVAFHPGNEGRHRRRQAQGDDQGHRHRGP